MADYQARMWQSWHRHMAMVMMAMQFMLETRIKNAELLPLLSCYDIQILIATTMPDPQDKGDSLRRLEPIMSGAAISVLTQPDHVNKTYELAGDHSFSMSEYAAEVSKQVGRPIVCNDLPPPAYAAALLGVGLPKIIVDVVIDADIRSARGELDSNSRDLSELLGRKTTPLSEAINLALRA
jgi:hypothetical protein